MSETRPSFAQDLAWRLEALAFDTFTAAMRLLPVDWASAFGGALTRTLGPLTGAHKTADRNLRLAFPDKDDAWRADILKKQWDEVGRTFAEFPIMDRIILSPDRVEIENAERLAQIADKREPVVFISGHFSNWEVMPAAIVQSGVDCQITYRVANNPYVDARIRKSRFRYGVRLFAPKGGDGAKELLAALKSGQSVALMNDQKFNGGVAAPFFGHLAHTAPGPTRLALRFGTVLQPMTVERTRGARFKAVVHDPIVLEHTEDRTADIETGVRRINDMVEAQIRKRPHEWFWVHKRWSAEAYDSLKA
ncbi:MAG: lysophospholipid acyltransferase family protein [Caulobacter sp.]